MNGIPVAAGGARRVESSPEGTEQTVARHGSAGTADDKRKTMSPGGTAQTEEGRHIKPAISRRRINPANQIHVSSTTTRTPRQHPFSCDVLSGSQCTE